jgi:glycosyltransferase involved in cell wall biosynthesis
MFGPNVLILSGVKGDTRRYRSFHPYEQLKLAGIDCQLSHITDSQLPTQINDASFILFHRVTFDSYVGKLLETVQKQDSLVIADVDDLVFDPTAFRWIDSPDFQDPVRAALYQENMSRNQATLQACQAITTSTHFLADQVSGMGKPVQVHRNAFSLEMMSVSEKAFQNRQPQAGRVVIGYASGTPTHNRDFQVSKPALKHILHRYPETELWIVGPLNPGEDWGIYADRIKQFKFIPWRELPKLLVQFDINIAPLVTDNPFAQSKSEIKYVEAGLVRVPTIASPTEAFRYAIQSGVNGYLAASDPEWIDALSLLIEQPENRHTTSERAYTDVIERYHPSVRSKELIDTLNQIHETIHAVPLWSPHTGEHVTANINNKRATFTWISPEIESKPSLMQMGVYTLRHRGLRTLIMQMWIYVRRLVSPIWPYSGARGES